MRTTATRLALGAGPCWGLRCRTFHMRSPLDRPVVRLRRRGRLARRTARAATIAIDAVGLAVPAGYLPDRAGRLDDLHTVRAKVAGQRGAVAAGALHADTAHLAEPAQLRQQLPVARNRGRELRGPSTPRMRSTAAATCTSRWVSAPPVTTSAGAAPVVMSVLQLALVRAGTRADGRTGQGRGLGNRLLRGHFRRSSCLVVTRPSDGSAQRQPSGAGSSAGQSRAGDCADPTSLVVWTLSSAWLTDRFCLIRGRA
jgi:hypothetical protein